MYLRLYLPRRHRRMLLFPPGLLALAGLLWLGTVAIGPWRAQLQPRHVIQLSMPPRPLSDTIYQSIRSIPFLYSQLFGLYNWQHVEFSGNSAHDSISMRAIARAIKTMRDDTVANCGVRVQIRPSTRYKELVSLLDLMSEYNIQKYLLDTYHGPTVLYVLVDSYVPQPVDSSPPYISCGTSAYTLRPTPPPPQQFFADKWLQPLRQSEWRASVWLLAGIVALGGWRVVRHRHLT
ncbi:MAG: hypothetical protein JWP58_2163 [Hymenobacter sp.]|nr:hypothetical protein [Hymenobacter sp.]